MVFYLDIWAVYLSNLGLLWTESHLYVMLLSCKRWLLLISSLLDNSLLTKSKLSFVSGAWCINNCKAVRPRSRIQSLIVGALFDFWDILWLQSASFRNSISHGSCFKLISLNCFLRTLIDLFLFIWFVIGDVLNLIIF